MFLARTYIIVLLIGPCQPEDCAEQLCCFDPSARPCPEQVRPKKLFNACLDAFKVMLDLHWHKSPQEVHWKQPTIHVQDKPTRLDSTKIIFNTYDDEHISAVMNITIRYCILQRSHFRSWQWRLWMSWIGVSNSSRLSRRVTQSARWHLTRYLF